MHHTRTEGLNGGESPGQVPLEWRITASDPASRCIRAVEVDGTPTDRVTDIRRFADGMFAVGELSNVSDLFGNRAVEMRLAKSVRVMWAHKEPCSWCRVRRREVVIDLARAK